MKVYELNMDGLVGPSYSYAGLAAGNIASTANAFTLANPAAAARQGITKMRLLHHLGIKQALLPPQQRPNLHLLSQLGFTGTPAEQVRKAKMTDPGLLSACYSAASMWTANTATVSSSLDTADQRVHFTAANLITNLHRCQEADFSAKLLKKIFADERYFQHHECLPRTVTMGDEGAANHNRLCAEHGVAGINFFVYGKQALPANNSYPAPLRYPARQTLEASQAIARNHLLNPQRVLFACQNPKAIDQGVFHNDVIGVANEFVMLLHEEALLHQKKILQQLKTMADFPLCLIEVNQKQISIADAVNSYLFNSQLVTLPAANTREKHMALISPIECEQHTQIKSFIDALLADASNPITMAHYMDLKQSMRNGGGPACLRLRVLLNEEELAAMHSGVIVTDALLDTLEIWIDKHYRPQLHADELDDPALITECFTALDELTSILDLGSIYPFQC
ncbi:N-succinylarginine dihydrolase [Legionella septentrionalis]|uniref:N-succinylarginine dihydrolase n=1 Tax=Legionella septentrionalis TaxID=2498109 RepID=UPI000F8E7BE9|nr:N-succinylarginine dihydrolase [Legionella septentrionalis]RUR09820.1 N-succinylarginine dihydrolase [Legionella septentrionalis]RUR13635.1 N-succinylarginine dihydrolase [Legionella septentrionalis]